VPSGINDLCIAEAITQLQTEIRGYGSREGELATRPATAGLRDLRDQAQATYGRKARTMAI
jgi:hypothetical protein